MSKSCIVTDPSPLIPPFTILGKGEKVRNQGFARKFNCETLVAVNPPRE